MKAILELVSRQCDSAIADVSVRAEALAMLQIAAQCYWRGADDRAMTWARRAQALAITARDKEIAAAKAAIRDRAK